MVVITGATDGLGPFYANYFATLGFQKMLLIGADAQKLSEVKAKLIEKAKHCEIYTHAVDLDRSELTRDQA